MGTFRARPQEGLTLPPLGPPYLPRIRAETSATSAERRRTRPGRQRRTPRRVERYEITPTRNELFTAKKGDKVVVWKSLVSPEGARLRSQDS